MDSDTALSEETLEMELDEIVRGIDAPHGQLPVAAIRAAQKHRDQIVSRLVQLIERAVQDVKGGGKLETNGHFIALFLLIEFRAAEAFETIIRAVSLPVTTSTRKRRTTISNGPTITIWSMIP